MATNRRADVASLRPKPCSAAWYACRVTIGGMKWPGTFCALPIKRLAAHESASCGGGIVAARGGAASSMALDAPQISAKRFNRAPWPSEMAAAASYNRRHA